MRYSLTSSWQIPVSLLANLMTVRFKHKLISFLIIPQSIASACSNKSGSIAIDHVMLIVHYLLSYLDFGWLRFSPSQGGQAEIGTRCIQRSNSDLMSSHFTEYMHSLYIILWHETSFIIPFPWPHSCRISGCQLYKHLKSKNLLQCHCTHTFSFSFDVFGTWSEVELVEEWKLWRALTYTHSNSDTHTESLHTIPFWHFLLLLHAGMPLKRFLFFRECFLSALRQNPAKTVG